MPHPEDPVGAFCDHVDVHLTGAPDGPLAGRTFAAKDLFDVAGETCCCGNPDWLATHEPAAATAPVLETLVAAGASLVGKTVTDELAFSLLGVNAHYGTPVNAAAPDTIPGGSSSGSAAAVAAGLVDFAVGTDTGGSVRVPAALCGLFGVRPTHGRVDLTGTFALAPSFDTVGWFARDALTLWQVTSALLPPVPADATRPTRVVVASDVLAACDEPVVDAFEPQLERLGVRLAVDHVDLLADHGLAAWAETFRVLQGAEIWAGHRAWLESVNPTMAVDVRDRFESLRAITDAQVTAARAARDQIQARLTGLLGDDGVLALPTVPELGPLLAADDVDFADFRRRTLELTSIAGLGGLPQVTIPAIALNEYPVGLSLVGPRDQDHQLVALAATIPATF